MMKTNEPYLVDPPRQPGSKGAGVQASTTVIRPVSIGGGPGRPVRVVAVQARKAEARVQPPTAARKEEPVAGRGPPGRGDQQERPLDRKGLEHIKSLKDSFRNDAADLLSELNLGHLVANRPKTDKGNEGERGENSGTG
jgi:hypothetical protein